MINIALADDHAILRKGVAEIISGFYDMQVIMEAGNGVELIRKMQLADTLPDVCIIDITMPEMNGYETANAIRGEWPKIKILALTMHATELNIIKMLRNGAHGYVLKDNDPEDLRVAITEVHKNGYYHSELVSGRMMHMMHDPVVSAALDINEREQHFLQLCCTELTYKEIADKMFLSPRTIDGYREALFAKLKVTSRTGLALFAIKAGFAELR